MPDVDIKKPLPQLILLTFGVPKSALRQAFESFSLVMSGSVTFQAAH